MPGVPNRPKAGKEWTDALRTSNEVRALQIHAASVAILLGFDILLKQFLPPADPHHPAGVWLHHVLDWGSVALVAALTWICLMMLLVGVVESTREVAKKLRGSQS